MDLDSSIARGRISGRILARRLDYSDFRGMAQTQNRCECAHPPTRTGMVTRTMSDMMDEGGIQTADVFLKFVEVGSHTGTGRIKVTF